MQIIQYAFNLQLPYSDWKPKIDSLNDSLATGALIVQDVNNNSLPILSSQDLKGNVVHPVAIAPSVDKDHFNRTIFDLSCTQLANIDNYDQNQLMKLLSDKLVGNPDPSQLTVDSTDLAVFQDECCVNNSRFVNIEPIKVSLLNDFNRVVGNDKESFINFLKEQLNVSDDNLLAIDAARVEYAGLVNGAPSVLLTSKVQLSYVKLSMDKDNNLVLFDRPIRLAFNGNQLNIPVQYKNGSTILPLKNQTVPMLIMYNYEMLLNGNPETVFLKDFTSQLSQRKLLNIPNDFFQDRKLILKKFAETEFYMNVSSYCNETVIDIDKPIDIFLQRLTTTKAAVKDPTNYPIHLLPIDNKIKYIIIPHYDETILKKAPPIAATVILVLVVIYCEITTRIKAWKKRSLVKKTAIFPLLTENELYSNKLSVVDNFDEELKAIEKALDKARKRIDNIQARKGSFQKLIYQVQSDSHFLNQLAIPEKAPYVPPI